mgnify:CR=1 FL=1
MHRKESRNYGSLSRLDSTGNHQRSNAGGNRIFTGNGYKVIISANPAAKEKVGSFHNSGFRSAAVTEWTTGRKVSVKSGSFKDTFAPYAVHIYCEGKLPEVMLSAPNDPSKNNPFAEAVRLRVNGRIYDGKASWIWEKKNMKKMKMNQLFMII